MTPQKITQVRPLLAAFTVEMFSDLPRKDQRAKGEPDARGAADRRVAQVDAADGGAAARLRVDHQQLQQFITSST